MAGPLHVTVHDADGTIREFEDVLAVGIGHVRQELVLVYPRPADAKAHRVPGSTTWTEITVVRVPPAADGGTV